MNMSQITAPFLHTLYFIRPEYRNNKTNQKSLESSPPWESYAVGAKTRVSWESLGTAPPGSTHLNYIRVSHPINESISSATRLLSPPLPPTRDHLITICSSCPSQVTEKTHTIRSFGAIKAHVFPLLPRCVSMCLCRVSVVPWNQKTWVQILSLLFTTHMTLGDRLTLSELSCSIYEMWMIVVSMKDLWNDEKTCETHGTRISA